MARGLGDDDDCWLRRRLLSINRLAALTLRTSPPHPAASSSGDEKISTVGLRYPSQNPPQTGIRGYWNPQTGSAQH